MFLEDFVAFEECFCMLQGRFKTSECLERRDVLVLHNFPYICWALLLPIESNDAFMYIIFCMQTDEHTQEN